MSLLPAGRMSPVRVRDARAVRGRTIGVAAVLAATLGVVGPAGAALAKTRPHNPVTVGSSSPAPGGNQKPGRHVPNPDFGGYVAYDSGSADVVTRFQVPVVGCGGTRHSALGPGAFLLSGPESHELLSAADLIVACRHGKVVMVQSLETSGNERFFQRPVRAGDVLIAHISEKPSGEMVQLTDTAPRRRFTLTVRDKGTFADEELVGNYALSDENDNPLPLPPHIAPTQFSSVRINGAPLGRTRTKIYDMTTQHLVRQLTPGFLRGARRDAFALRRVTR